MARWYIIHAYSGFENKVRDAILSEATRMGLDQLVEKVEVPTETVTEVRRGKKVQSERVPEQSHSDGKVGSELRRESFPHRSADTPSES